MKLGWISSAYRLTADAREWNLLRDLVVEAGYALHRLPPDEVRLRLGVSSEALDEIVRGWTTGVPFRDMTVAEVELIRACWFEALDFFSDNDFETRTGWSRDEAAAAFVAFRADRRAATMTRQWGEV